MGSAALMVLVSGCASVSVREVKFPNHPKSPPKPERIFVVDFHAPPETFRVDRSGEDLEEFREELAGRLSRELVSRLNKHVMMAQRVPPDMVKPGRRALLVTGEIVRVNQGSRALRMTLGLGAGGTKLETRVVVHDLSGPEPVPILSFETTGGSNATPGAVFNLSYWAAGAAAVGQAISGLSFDTVRTSREITAMLSEYMAQQGWIAPEDSLRPKKLGEWP